MKSASALRSEACPPVRLRRRHVVVAGLVLAVSAGARTSSSRSSAKRPPGLTSKGSRHQERPRPAGSRRPGRHALRPVRQPAGACLHELPELRGRVSTPSTTRSRTTSSSPWARSGPSRGRGRRRVLQRRRPGGSVNVSFYSNASGDLPGTLVAERLEHGVHERRRASRSTLDPGRVARSGNVLGVGAGESDLHTERPVGLGDRTVQSNRRRLPKPGRGVRHWLHDLGTRGSTCSIDPASPDQVFRLRGSTRPPPPPPHRLHHRLRLRHLRRHLHRLRRLRHHHRRLRRPATSPPPPPPPARCRVPRVIGLRLGSARQRIRRANCSRRPRPPRSHQASAARPRHRSEPEARRRQAPRLPGQPAGRPAVARRAIEHQ